MSSQQRTFDGVRILSLDSGGPGTYSQALILKEIEEIVIRRFGGDNSSGLIRDQFDLIGGVGFGGLLAIMLGRLGMTVAQATDGLLKVAQEIFPLDVVEVLNPEIRSKRLRESIESIVRERGLPIDAKLHDKAAEMPQCIVVVFATSKDDQQAHALRTYNPKGSSLDPTIIEAACATISIPPFFAPVVVGPPMLRLSFNGGPKDGMSPASKLLDQSKALYGREREISALISIGCGRPSFKHQPRSSDPSQQQQRYESIGSGTFLDVLSPGNMIRDSLRKRKDKKAQSSKVAGVATIPEPNAGWYVVNRMADECAETSKAISSHFAGSVRYMRLDVEKEMSALNLDDWNGLGSIMGHTQTYLEELELESDIFRLLENSKQSKRPSKSIAKSPPRVSTFFVPRPAAYAIMKQHLLDDPGTNQRIMAITGMGGCGKTQLVSYFLRQNDSLFSCIIYVDASSEESVKMDLEAWIQSIKDHEKNDWEDALTYIRRGLRDEKWILVFDNADDIKVKLTAFFPDSNHGTILITSRNRNRGNLSTTFHIELGVMDSEEAMSSLLLSAKRHAPLASGEDTAARSVLAELGHLPLAISLAGSYCRQLSSSAESPYAFKQYLEDFRSERSQLMDHQQADPLDRYEQSVNTTIALSYSHLTDSEKEYLDLFTTFDGTDISLEIFSEAAKNQFEDRREWKKRPAEHKESLERLRSLFLTDQTWKAVEIKTAIANLTSSSLLSTKSVVGTIHIYIHPLVQSWACDRRDQVRSQHILMAAQVLAACDNRDNPRLSQAMLPHVQLLATTGKASGLHVNCWMAFASTLLERGHYEAAAEYCKVACEELKGTARTEELIMLEATAVLALIHYRRGQYGDALQLQLEVWNKHKEKLGADHLDTLTSANHLASTYGALGRYQDALQLELEVWEKRKEKQGAEHPHTLTSANNLASTYVALGRYKDALPLQLEVWKNYKEKQGVDHLDTLTSASNLASIYGELGRHQDALQLQLEIWEKRKAKLGVDHPHTLISANNLASTYGALGHHQDALKLQLEVWEMQKEKRGADHPHTLTASAQLASTYRELGRHQDALQLQQEVWEKRKEKLGVDHPRTLASANDLASTYGELDRHQDAMQLKLEVWEKQKEKLGADHPDTLISASNIASTYRALGRHQDALQLQLEVWEAQKKNQGVNHPNTLTSANNLGSTYWALGRHQDALPLQLEVWEKQKEKLGVDHPKTLTSANNLASIYGALGRHQDALQLKMEVWEKRKEKLGVDHPDTLDSANHIASTYRALGRHQDALQLQLEVWEKRRDKLGVDHPHTLTSADDLASTYGSLGRHQDALQLRLEVWEKWKEKRGVDHLYTVASTGNLATAYVALGRYQDALPLQLEVWEKHKEKLGMDHPHTLWSGFSLACTHVQQGNRELAFPLLRQVSTHHATILGPQHPDTRFMIETASFFGLGTNNETL